MKFNDALIGAALAALGAVVLWHIQSFPPMLGQKYGPAWFPGLIAIGATVVIHLAFYKLLKVPLPWGIFERFAF